MDNTQFARARRVDSAPYFHDGGSPTLHSAIFRHAGSATRVTKAYSNLATNDQQAIITFLQTLKAPADAPRDQCH